MYLCIYFKKMKKYFAEFIGTFILIFCGTGAMTINEVTGGSVTHVGIGLTWGLIVMAMIYAFGKVLFPPALGPTMPKNSPALTCIEISSSTFSLP